MCFHNSMSAKAIKLAARYGRKSDIIEIYRDVLNEQYHINAFNFPKYPIITASDEIQVFNWGLIPFWVKTEEDAEEMRKMTLNARAETIFEKPSFRESIMRKRCIVPLLDICVGAMMEFGWNTFYFCVIIESLFSMAGSLQRFMG